MIKSVFIALTIAFFISAVIAAWAGEYMASIAYSLITMTIDTMKKN